MNFRDSGDNSETSSEHSFQNKTSLVWKKVIDEFKRELNVIPDSYPADISLAKKLAQKAKLIDHLESPYPLSAGIDDLKSLHLHYRMYLKTIKTQIYLILLIICVYTVPLFALAFTGIQKTNEKWGDISGFTRFYYFICFTKNYIMNSKYSFLEPFIYSFYVFVLFIAQIVVGKLLESQYFKELPENIDPSFFTLEVRGIKAEKIEAFEDEFHAILGKDLLKVTHLKHMNKYFELKKKLKKTWEETNESFGSCLMGSVSGVSSSVGGTTTESRISRCSEELLKREARLLEKMEEEIEKVMAKPNEFYAGVSYFVIRNLVSLQMTQSLLKNVKNFKESYGKFRVENPLHHRDILWENGDKSTRMADAINIVFITITCCVFSVVNYHLEHKYNTTFIQYYFGSDSKATTTLFRLESIGFCLFLLVVQLVVVQIGVLFIEFYFAMRTFKAISTQKSHLFVYYNVFYTMVNTVTVYYGIQIAFNQQADHGNIPDTEKISLNAYLGLQMIKNAGTFVGIPFLLKIGRPLVVNGIQKIKFRFRPHLKSTRKAYELFLGSEHDFGLSSTFLAQSIGFMAFYNAIIIPMINVIILIAMVLFYCVEKYYLLRVHRSPEYISFTNLMNIFKVQLLVSAIAEICSVQNQEIMSKVFTDLTIELNKIVNLGTSSFALLWIIVAIGSFMYYNSDRIKTRSICYLIRKKQRNIKAFEEYNFKDDHFSACPSSVFTRDRRLRQQSQKFTYRIQGRATSVGLRK